MNEPDALLAQAEDALRMAQRRGAEAAEVFLWDATERLGRRAHRLREIEERDVSGVSVRVFHDGRLASAARSGLDDVSIGSAVAAAIDGAALVPKNPTFERFAAPPGAVGPPSSAPKGLVEPDIDRLLSTLDATADVLERDPRSDYHDSSIATRNALFAVANTEGVAVWDRNAYEGFSAEVRIQRTGVVRATSGRLHGRSPVDEAHDLTAFADGLLTTAWDAADRPQPLDRAVSEVILDAGAAAPFIENLAPSMAGKAALDGRSRFADRLDRLVASPSITLVDKPHDGQGCRNQRVDDEGVPTKERTVLIEHGVLRNYLFPWSAALATGREPTGHGLRPLNGRHGGPPGARVANLDIAPGDHTVEEMVERAERAVWIRGPLLGAFTVDAMSGDVSVGASIAFLVEDGRVQHAIDHVTLGANVFEAIQNVRAVGRHVERGAAGTSTALWMRGPTCVT